MMIQQEFRGIEDQVRMIELARTSATENIHVIDLPYRLSSWAFDYPANVGLWMDDTGQLQAWAVLQTPFWTVDIILSPDAGGELQPTILPWVDRHARANLGTPYGRPAWYVNVFADQNSRRHALEQSGFSDQSNLGEDAWSKVWMERPAATSIPEYPVPKGFTLRSLAGEAELEAYVSLHQSTFETKNMTLAWRRRTLQHPAYLPDLDVVVCAPDGQLVAFCIGWLIQDTHGTWCGQIEPLGCLAAYRRYALGRLALCEVLRRLQAQCAQSIYVETDSYRNTAFRLYESLGFQVVRNILVYRKDYEGLSG